MSYSFCGDFCISSFAWNAKLSAITDKIMDLNSIVIQFYYFNVNLYHRGPCPDLHKRLTGDVQ